MSKKEDNRITGLPEQEPEIFGRSKSREEVKAEIKAEKKAQRAAIQESLRAQRQEKKNAPKQKQPELWIMLGILGAIFVVFAVFMGMQFAKDMRMKGFEQDESRDTYFVAPDEVPEMSKKGLTAAVNKVYYTKDGHLCVEMTMGNGRSEDMYMYSLEVQIYNGNEELVASGYTEEIREDYFVPARGTAPYTFYISPEFVKIADDPLTDISYSVTASGFEPEDEK